MNNTVKWGFKNEGMSISNDELIATSTTGHDVYRGIMTTEALAEKKTYFEITVTGQTTLGRSLVGIANESSNSYTNADLQGITYNDVGAIREYTGSSYIEIGTFESFGNEDVIGVAIDIPNKKITFHKNGVYSDSYKFEGDYNRGFVRRFHYQSDATTSFEANFGSSAFQYPIPQGYQPYDILNKTLILYNGSYYKYDEDNGIWINVGTVPSSKEEQELLLQEHGMENTSELSSDKIKLLGTEGIKIHTYVPN